jgi:hypothetical protein
MLIFFVTVIISVVYFTKLHPVKAVSIIYYVLLTRYVFNANN